MNTKQVKCKVPTNLSHKPIIAVEDYDIIESYFYNKSDARCLSVGHAQYDDPHPEEISAKVFRHTGERWSPQSEELPLHRCVDLTNLIVQSIMISEEILYCDDKVTIKPQYIKKEELHYIKNIYNCELRKKLKELNYLLNILLAHDGKDNNSK